MKEARKVLVMKASRVFRGVEMSAGDLKCALPVFAAIWRAGENRGTVKWVRKLK